MAYTIKTLADCKQSLADRHDNGVLPTASATLALWTRFLNRGVEYCTDRLKLEKSTSLTTSSGTIALPDDFLVANRVFDSDNNELAMIDQNNISPTGYVYWITGNQTDGFALNTTADKTYTVYYSFKPSPMSSDSDECIIPDIEAVVAYAYAYIRKGESDPFEDADLALQECDSRLTEMQSTNSANANFVGFRMPDDTDYKYSWE